VRRIVAVFLPFLRIELARASLPDDAGPLALVVARPGGGVKDERSLLGNTRLDEVCPEARSHGLRPRQTIASARARCAELRVRVVALDAVREALSRISEALLAFGSTVSFDLESNVVWLDVTGCAHLHGCESDPAGETTLAARVQEFVEKMSHACRVAVADGPRVAAAVARLEAKGAKPTVVSPGESKTALRALPLGALPLTESSMRWLARLGMRTVGDLQKLPRSSLSTRLGASAATVMALLDGEDSTPLTAYVPPIVPEETATLEYGIELTEALLFVVKGLSDRMALRLAGRAMAATRLELVLGLDRALASGEPRAVLNQPLAAPLAGASEILSVLRSRIEPFTIEAPILTVTLRVTEMVARAATPLHLFVPEAKASRSLPRLVAELEAELGPGRVGILALTNRWLPHERSRLVPIGSPPIAVPHALASPDSPRGSLLSGAVEPTRLLVRPILVGEGAVFRVRVRQTSTEWWTGELGSRDFATVWVGSIPAMAWVEISSRSRQAWIRGWMDG
jgi:protein ImuB